MAELVMIVFEGSSTAHHALAQARSVLDRRAWVDDLAVVERHRSGRVATHTTHDSVERGAKLGGVAGLVVGLVFPPAIVGAALLGAGLGAGWEKASKELGLDAGVLREIRDALAPGQSALLLYAPEGDLGSLLEAVAAFGPSAPRRFVLPDANPFDTHG
ncbi:MAG: DUF1269 domain-containing protein [Acidimicrobiales bacterium]|nr:DUF1269 domain-containing protein [Acidimicrobiales bacterium]